MSLNQYLHRFNIVPQPWQCQCGEAQRETVAHFLLRCRDHEEHRHALEKAVGWDGMKVEKLLGDVTKAKLLKYVEKTGRFEF